MLIVIDGCDDAIVGIAEDCVVYDYHKLVDVFMKQGMTEDDAIEWIEYNIYGSIPNVIIMYPANREEVDDYAEELRIQYANSLN